jgi:hypothetical protein
VFDKLNESKLSVSLKKFPVINTFPLISVATEETSSLSSPPKPLAQTKLGVWAFTILEIKNKVKSRIFFKVEFH